MTEDVAIGTERRASRAAAIALALALVPAGALAEFPGEKWHVTRLDISVAPDAGDGDTLAARVRQGLNAANRTYFYGEHPVRMEVNILSPGAMSVVVRDQLTGALVGHAGTVKLGATPDRITDQALAWMDGLECAAPGCSAAAGPVVAAVEPPAQVAISEAALPETAAVVLGRAGPNTDVVPVPVDAPRGVAQGTPAQGTGAIARNPVAGLDGVTRLSRLSLARVGQFSYTATDPVISGSPNSLAPTAERPASAPEGSTAVGRLFNRVAVFFGIKEQPQQRAAAIAPPQPATRVRFVNPAAAAPQQQTAQQDVPTFGVPAATPPAQAAAGAQPQVAALSPSGSLPPITPGIVRVPSAGLDLPSPRVDAQREQVVTPIRVARAPDAAAKPLTVRLDPEVLALAGSASVGTVLGAYGSPRTRLQLVATDGAGAVSPRGVDRILRARGLALANDLYAKAERVYWNGNTGSRGYWINVPGGVPTKYVLIASSRGSVIANVHSQGSSVQVSDAVAEAVSMQPDAWSDIQVIALRGGDTQVRRRTRDRVR